MPRYEDLELEQLRDECRKRGIAFGDKDGRRNLASKLRVNDKETTAETGTGEGGENPFELAPFGVVGTSIQEQMQLLEFQRQMRREEREARKEEREALMQEREARMREKKLELELEREKRETKILLAKEEEERQVREEERLRALRKEKEESEMRLLEKQESINEKANIVKKSKPTPFKMREMRPAEDIDDFFRVFEMTAKAQLVPEKEWMGHLVPKLSEKAKAVYLELSADEALDYSHAKEVIIQSYQLTIDHYRYRFRTCEKQSDEDFVQWARRTRRFLDRWMAVAKATGDAEKILEQFTMERMLDAMSPELQAWLKERKPQTAVELATLANEHVQARKGPLVDGKYVSISKRGNSQKKPNPTQSSQPEKPGNTQKPEPPKADSPKEDRTKGKPIKCFKCQEMGHISYDCPLNKRRNGRGYLCMTPLNSRDEFPDCYIKGLIAEKPALMLVDTGCSRTLVHSKYVGKSNMTAEKMTLLTATGERVVIPLAWVLIKRDGSAFRELVGVAENLPVDCLLGRSSYGKTLTRQHILDQWKDESQDDNQAFVMTRSQAALQKAKERSDKLIDRENHLASKTLAAKPVKESEPWSEGDLKELFKEDKEEGKKEIFKLSKENKTPKPVEIKETGAPKSNILDRNLSQVITDQKLDVTLTKARQLAADQKDGYFLREGLLMHRKILQSEHDGREFIDRVVVPESYRQEILRVAHTIPIAGHMGRDKTLDRISSHFYWPKLSFDVSNYVATCPECQMVARKRVNYRAPLKPVPIVTEPFRKIAIDLIGELPRTKTGYRYILTVVDYATRYPDAFPLKTTHSKVIADALILYFSRVGIPEEIVSDQGSNLIGKLMTQLFELLGISRIKTSVYHAEANGLVERFNGTLKQMLRKFVGECTEYWDKYLPYLLFAYREVPCQSTGYSPFELLYGRTVRGPLAVIKETWLEEKSPEMNLVSHVLEIRRRLATMQDAASENLKKTQANQKQLYDVKSSKRVVEVGDKVLVLLPTPGNKLETKWTGPFTVTQVKNDGRSIEVDTGKSVKQRRTYNINLISRWQSRPQDEAFIAEEICEMSLPHEMNVPELKNEETWEDVEISSELDEGEKAKVLELLHEFSDVFSGIPNRTTAAVHRIDTGDAKPIRSAPYKIPQRLEEQVENEIQKMLDMEIIRPSESPWAAGVVIVPKPDHSIRLCVDYRKLNKVTKMDAYPIPRTERMIERVAAARYITTLDMTKGYWQIPLEESTIEKSAFITSSGLYEFLVMPFGMKTAPATFQRMMKEKVLKGLEDFTDAYIDDVEIDTGTTFSQHLDHIRRVLQRLRDFHLNARPTKCKIAKQTVDFVGHNVGNGAIKPRNALVRAIQEFPRPENKRQVRSFLGLVGYYRKFISNFSEKASPLTDLTRGKCPTKVKWNEQCEHAFNDLKKALQEAPVLKPPKWDQVFIVQVDASNRGLGAILCQKDEEGNEHPIVFASRKLLPREEKLSTTEKECLGVVWAVEVFRYYIYGRRFILETDHNPLVWLNKVRDKSRKLLRWSLTLQEYEMEIRHKKGSENGNVDALSRM